jgi:cyclic beta-1,2-glucan synthetase
VSVVSPILRGGPPRLAGAMPAVHLLGNGHYSVWLTEAGMGRSSWRGAALTRWRGDRVEDADGWRFWIRDAGLGRSWPVFGPVAPRPAEGSVLAGPGRFAWSRRDHALETRLEVAVAPGHDAELRRVTLRNLATRPRRVDVTACLELVLHDPAADAAHPAFSKLFVQTDWDAAARALVATRRPRGADERHPCAALHVVGDGTPEHETDRARFLGRDRTWARPDAVARRGPLSGTVGNVLDPVFACRRAGTLAPGEERTWTFVLAAAWTRAEAIATLAALAGPAEVESAFAGAPAAALERLERLGFTPEDGETTSLLAGALLYGEPRLRAAPEALRTAGDDAAARAALGLGRAQPVVVARLDEPGVAAEWDRLVRANRHWRAHGVDAALVASGGAPPAAAPEPGVHDAAALAPGDRLALEAGARIVVTRATLALVRRPLAGGGEEADEPAVRAVTPPRRRAARREREPLRFENGHGGFSRDGREYVVRLDPLRRGGHRLPPLAWVNVLANPRFGTLVSETGAGFTWSGNSREHRLTPWANDPLLDPHGETLHVVDESSGLAWSPLPGPLPHASGYEARHGLGASRFLLEAESLRHDTVVAVDRDSPVKLVRVRLTNPGDTPRPLALVGFTRLVLGAEDAAARRVVTEHHPASGALLAVNPAAGPWAGAVAFAHVVGVPADRLGWTTDRAAFLGRHGSVARPRALGAPQAFDGAAGPVHDPCFAWRAPLVLAPGETRDVTFVLGEAADRAEVLALVARFSAAGQVEHAIEAARGAWDARVSRLRVETPAPELDLMLNAWLPYQTLACRLWGRSALYQSGGAFGFRDQLQDALALLPLEPGLARAQILLHAAHQFAEGDVLHWWHPPDSRGMRTRFADDLLWLPYLAETYVRVTGDQGVLDEPARTLVARALEPGEDEAFVVPRDSGERVTVYEHAARAIDRSLAVGAHGLPLFGCGDWNDGMNRVGREGRGESVWMGWFLGSLLAPWADLAEARGEPERAGRWRGHRERLRAALDAHAWDGEWYRRGWYDDGSPLGSGTSDECRIDALAQAWSVISGLADPGRAERAMDALEARLVSEPEGLIRLLAPPFQHTPHDPGYIKGYVAGVRENGGQYTHAALWVVRALARLGRRDRAARLLAMLSPARHAHDPASVRRYQVEPYAVAADIYGVAPHVGRGGWTWYTGSSGWMYRVGLEDILGLRLEAGATLRVKPCIPDDWPGFTLDWTLPGGQGTTLALEVRNPHGRAEAVTHATLDGAPVEVADGEAVVALPADGAAHRLEVELGPAR